MKKVVIYVRVSSKEQKREGYSIPAQKKILWEYAKANSFNVVKKFEDDETAKSAGRTGFNEMIEYLKDNKDVNTILVEKTDRLYRNFKDYVTIDDLKVTIFLVKENEEIGRKANSHQKFMHGIKVLMAKNYIDNLSEEVKKGQKEKAESGILPGTPPVGYRLVKKDGKSVPEVDEKNKNLPIKMFEYYATGLYSLESLAIKVKDEGLFIVGNFPSHSKMKNLIKSTVQRTLRNPFYYGDFLWKGKLYKGTHEPLVSRGLWNKTQETLDRFENKKMLSKYNTLKFTFKGLLTCKECGRTITAEKKIKPSGKKYIYYHCTKFQTNCSQKPVNEDKINKQIVKRLEKTKLAKDTILYVAEGLKQSLHLKHNIEEKTSKNLEAQRSKLQKRLNILYEDKLDEIIDKEFYKNRFKEYSTEIGNLTDKINKYAKADISYYGFASKILELSNNASFLYKEATPEEKRELLGFLLSDSLLGDGKALISYKKPFENIYQRAQCCDWRGRRDSNARPSA